MRYEYSVTKKLYNPEYEVAFENYLKYGKPITIPYYLLEIKSIIQHYIWRTQGDFRVRPSNAANNGKIFGWDKPPTTGHPGQSPNFRCRPEVVIASCAEDIELYITMCDTSTWPRPPIDGVLVDDIPSKAQIQQQG